MVPITTGCKQLMTHTGARQQILEEITYLKDALDARRSAHTDGRRPVAGCVVSAYQRLITAQYERLERIDERRNDPRWLHNPSSIEA